MGCPHLCAFCDQRTISGEDKAPKPDDVRRICEQAVREISSHSDTEIAFFGGSFTAIRREYMISLLQTANEYVTRYGFKGIRISTRPDYIDDEILRILKQYNVTSIELGAQSLDDEVLIANERGHSCEDVYKACGLIKQYGFELGLQMMVGLYKSTRERELETMRRIIELKPDTVRIYPVVILKGTKLGSLYLAGEYKTMPFDEAVELCADMLYEFDGNGISVIKCGLHASEFVERDMVGGFYHPAFRELCEGLVYRKILNSTLFSTDSIVSGLKNNKKIRVTVCVPSSAVSKALGHKKANYEFFKQKGIELKIIGEGGIPKYKCKVREVSVCT